MQNAGTLLVAVAVVLGSACSGGHEGRAGTRRAKKTGGLAPLSRSSTSAMRLAATSSWSTPRTQRSSLRIAVGKRPRGIKLSRDGKLLYAAVTGSPLGGPNVDESKLPPADRDADGIGRRGPRDPQARARPQERSGP